MTAYLVSAGVLVAAVAFGLWARMHAVRAQEAVWRQVAADRGAAFAPGRWWVPGESMAIEETRGGARIRADAMATSSGGTSRRTYVRCRARFALPAGPRFRIAPQTRVATVAKALGMRDVTVGVYDAFDDAFVVRCDDVDALRACLRPHTARALADVLGAVRVHSDGDTIELLCDSDLRNPAVLRACLDVVGDLATADLFGLDALCALPGARPVSATSVTVAAPGPVDLGVAADGGRARTYARASVPADLPATDAVLAAGDLPDAIPPDARRHAEVLAGARLAIAGGTATLTFPRAERDGDRLRAAAGLLGALAQPHGGAFR
ncbi:MAG: hypothetical protein D6689_21370 [Deltaproteobacteria bacterium]|nr:MAG: hypothetical protein D6689_21370 [Deltaproteobacteria bacterium]